MEWNIDDFFPFQEKCLRAYGALVLYGIPSLGEITLALVAINHCGYYVVEINTSHDRSALTIKGKFLDVVHMKAIRVNFKLKCLVTSHI